MVDTVLNNVKYLIAYFLFISNYINAEEIILNYSSDTYLGEIGKLSGTKIIEGNKIRSKPLNTWNIAQSYEKVMPLLKNKKSKVDFIVVSPQYLGDFKETGKIEDLSNYLKKCKDVNCIKYKSDLFDIYKESYTKINGSGPAYAVVLDGDTLALHYRPSFFKDKELQKKFKQKFKQELKVPTTWSEYDKTALFFSNELKNKGIYGSHTFSVDPWVWAFWFARAASNNVRFFDNKMNITINSKKSISSLENYVKSFDHSLPGIDDLTGGAAVKAWKTGNIVMAIWWTDLTKLSSLDLSDNFDFEMTNIPGKKNKNTIKIVNQIPYGRVAIIPNWHSPQRKRIIFKYLMSLAGHKNSINLIPNPRTGLDPFLKSHFKNTDEYLKKSINYGNSINTKEKVNTFLDISKKSITTSVPQPNWPGSYRYINTLGKEIRKAILKQKTAKEALDTVKKKWESLRQRLGKEKQNKHISEYNVLYNKYYNRAKK
jgi:multiple sugar transport system substrate-binding protein